MVTFKLLRKFSQDSYTMLHHRQSGQAAKTTRLTENLLLSRETWINDICEDFSVKIINLKATKGHAEEWGTELYLGHNGSYLLFPPPYAVPLLFCKVPLMGSVRAWPTEYSSSGTDCSSVSPMTYTYSTMAFSIGFREIFVPAYGALPPSSPFSVSAGLMLTPLFCTFLTCHYLGRRAHLCPLVCLAWSSSGLFSQRSTCSPPLKPSHINLYHK